ncbi:MAG: hypothetical protein ACE5EY_18330, partial [Anaerolineae bacterium]
VGVATAVTLTTAGLIAAPLFAYLARHPGIEARVTELSSPLRAALAGDWRPLWGNVLGSLRLFFVEGDSAWRYNIPGRPWLPPVWAVLFVVGLGTAVWWVVSQRERGGLETGDWRLETPNLQSLVPSLPKIPRMAAALTALAWLGLGLSPVLVTGSELATTQAIGMQPVLYLFPALALAEIWRRVQGRWLVGLLALFLVGTAVFTYRDYFGRWTNAPEVRVQYEAAMVAAMAYLNENGTGAAAVSTITPAPEHTPALALLALQNAAVTPRFFDGRGSLLLPDTAESLVVVPGFTPLALESFWDTAVLADTLPMRQTDLDKPVQIYRVNKAMIEQDWQSKLTVVEPTTLGSAATLLGYSQSSGPNGAISVVTWWRGERPLPDAQLFTHLQGADGAPVAQADRLDVPGAGWLAGDQFLQLHTLTLPPDLPDGRYPLVVGLCQQTEAGCVRLTAADGRDLILLTTVAITP